MDDISLKEIVENFSIDADIQNKFLNKDFLFYNQPPEIHYFKNDLIAYLNCLDKPKRRIFIGLEPKLTEKYSYFVKITGIKEPQNLIDNYKNIFFNTKEIEHNLEFKIENFLDSFFLEITIISKVFSRPKKFLNYPVNQQTVYSDYKHEKKLVNKNYFIQIFNKFYEHDFDKFNVELKFKSKSETILESKPELKKTTESNKNSWEIKESILESKENNEPSLEPENYHKFYFESKDFKKLNWDSNEPNLEFFFDFNSLKYNNRFLNFSQNSQISFQNNSPTTNEKLLNYFSQFNLVKYLNNKYLFNKLGILCYGKNNLVNSYKHFYHLVLQFPINMNNFMFLSETLKSVVINDNIINQLIFLENIVINLNEEGFFCRNPEFENIKEVYKNENNDSHNHKQKNQETELVSKKINKISKNNSIGSQEFYEELNQFSNELNDFNKDVNVAKNSNNNFQVRSKNQNFSDDDRVKEQRRMYNKILFETILLSYLIRSYTLDLPLKILVSSKMTEIKIPFNRQHLDTDILTNIDINKNQYLEKIFLNHWDRNQFPQSLLYTLQTYFNYFQMPALLNFNSNEKMLEIGFYHPVYYSLENQKIDIFYNQFSTHKNTPKTLSNFDKKLLKNSIKLDFVLKNDQKINSYDFLHKKNDFKTILKQIMVYSNKNITTLKYYNLILLYEFNVLNINNLYKYKNNYLYNNETNFVNANDEVKLYQNKSKLHNKNKNETIYNYININKSNYYNNSNTSKLSYNLDNINNYDNSNLNQILYKKIGTPPLNIRKKILNLKSKENNPNIISELILDLCNWRNLGIKELAILLDRNEKYLFKYISKLKKEKKIKLLYPDRFNHKNQKYILN